MKRVMLGTVLSLSCMSAQANQEAPVPVPAAAPVHEPQPSAHSEIIHNGTIGPILKINLLGDGAITNIGARANITLFDKLLLGLGGYGAVTHSQLEIAKKSESVTHIFGTLGIGARFPLTSFIYLTNFNNFGLGYLKLKERDQSGIAYSIEPELSVEFDVFSLFRVGGGLSYRFLFPQGFELKSSDLSGFGGQIYVEFGWLNKRAPEEGAQK